MSVSGKTRSELTSERFRYGGDLSLLEGKKRLATFIHLFIHLFNLELFRFFFLFPVSLTEILVRLLQKFVGFTSAVMGMLVMGRPSSAAAPETSVPSGALSW